MSLLLEALKKAERAKEEAQRRARGEPALTLQSSEAAPAPAPAEEKPVVTRAELPNLQQPLEILSDEIAPTAAPDPAPAPAPTLEKIAPRPQPEARKAPETQSAERATGKKVFEAKFKEPNPRLPFFIVMSLLGVFAIGTLGYFWYQLRPRSALVNTNPARTGNEVAVAPTETKPAALVVAPSGPAAIPGLPGTAVQTAVAPRKPEPVVTVPKPAPAPRVAAGPEQPRIAPRPVEQPVLAPVRPPPQIHPKVDSAYAAYQSGDFVAARTDYQEALREDAGNRDALLGLAAIDVRTGRFEAAEATYLRLLQTDPNDSHAQAGLIALRGGRLDPLATESRVKSLLAADPSANVLQFTLGNQLAQQGRWAEAQQAYFKAFAADPENADFAYNLAVSLDHLRQTRPAAEYYRRAVSLAEKRGASFDLAAARARAAQLGN